MLRAVHGFLRALTRIMRVGMRVRHIEIVCNCNRTILILLTHRKGEFARRYSCPYCKRDIDLESLLKDTHLLVGWTVE